MGFKGILREIANHDEEAKKLNSILQKNFRTDLKPLLYRGTSDEIDGRWEVRDIRKNREPRDTLLFTHILISFLENTEYPNVPKRSESKFATTNKNRAEDFGDHVYVVFPDKESNVANTSGDATMTYFDPFYSELYSAYQNISKNPKFYKDKWPNLYKFLSSFYKFTKNEPDIKPTEFLTLLKNKWEAIKSEKDDLVKALSDSDNMKKLMVSKSLENSFDRIYKYFDDLKSNFVENSNEILFDGDNYLLVEPIYFQTNFEWDGSSWNLE